MRHRIFSTQDYRRALRDLIELQKEVEPELTYQKVAEVAQIQKSYLSQVLAGKADLSQDQLYSLCEYFSLEPLERDYLELLLEFARTGLHSRKLALKKKIKGIQDERKESRSRLRSRRISDDPCVVTEYYLEAMNQIVHVGFSIEAYRNNPKSLAQDLGLQQAKFDSILERLVRLGIIRLIDSKVEVLVSNVHLPREFPVFAPWQSEMRLLTIQRSKVSQTPENYNFTAVFSADEATRATLHEKLLLFLEDAQKLVRSAQAQSIYQLNLDLIGWT